MNNLEFRNSLKVDSKYNLIKLLALQRKLEQCKGNKGKMYNLLLDLNSCEKAKLIKLYQNQILNLNNSINTYKNLIIKERKILNNY